MLEVFSNYLFGKVTVNDDYFYKINKANSVTT